jgi:hypothetical protein
VDLAGGDHGCDGLVYRMKVFRTEQEGRLAAGDNEV